jgi:hypothetical protein
MEARAGGIPWGDIPEEITPGSYAAFLIDQVDDELRTTHRVNERPGCGRYPCQVIGEMRVRLAPDVLIGTGARGMVRVEKRGEMRTLTVEEALARGWVALEA